MARNTASNPDAIRHIRSRLRAAAPGQYALTTASLPVTQAIFR